MVSDRSTSGEWAWRLVDPIIQAGEAADAPPLVSYDPGSWGPVEADRLMSRDGNLWRKVCTWSGDE